VEPAFWARAGRPNQEDEEQAATHQAHLVARKPAMSWRLAATGTGGAHVVGGLQQVGHHHHPGAGGQGAAHAGVGVFQHQAVLHRHAELCGGGQEDVRRRLAAAHLVAAHHAVHPRQQAHGGELGLGPGAAGRGGHHAAQGQRVEHVEEAVTPPFRGMRPSAMATS
jgi:hypothetical protein